MSDPSAGALRRVAIVLLAYAAGAALVWVVGGWLRTVLALPPMFGRLLRGALGLGALVAALMAWHYPRLAVGPGPTAPPEETDRDAAHGGASSAERS